MPPHDQVTSTECGGPGCTLLECGSRSIPPTHGNRTPLLRVRELVILLGTATFSNHVERNRTDGELGHFFLSHKLVQIGEGQAFRRWQLKERDSKPVGSTKEAVLAKNARVSGFLCLVLSSVGGVVGSAQLQEARAPSSSLSLLGQGLSIQPFPLLPPPPHSPRNPVEILPARPPPALQEALASP